MTDTRKIRPVMMIVIRENDQLLYLFTCASVGSLAPRGRTCCRRRRAGGGSMGVSRFTSSGG